MFVTLMVTNCQHYIPSEYFVGLRPDTQMERFKESLITEFGIMVKKSWDIKTTKLLHVIGNEVFLTHTYTHTHTQTYYQHIDTALKQPWFR